jgi:hypothetical protein
MTFETAVANKIVMPRDAVRPQAPGQPLDDTQHKTAGRPTFQPGESR